MNKLYVDIGNSYIKVAEKTDLAWKLVYRDRTDREKRFYSWLDDNLADKGSGREIIVCSVNNRISAALDQNYKGRNLRRISTRDIPAELINYETPQILGTDRFFACYGASGLTPADVVVIDAGSACTIDFMSAGAVFQGGVIMPGLAFIRESLSRLSLPETDETLPERWPGTSTADCIKWGTTGVFIQALTGFLYKYRLKYGEFDLFVTGGDTVLAARYLQEEFQPRQRPYLVFEGMEAACSRLLHC
ncbi:MAG: type III pantothenate kinase [Balneolaceae bacterium]